MDTVSNPGKHKLEYIHVFSSESGEIVECDSNLCPGNALYSNDAPSINGCAPDVAGRLTALSDETGQFTGLVDTSPGILWDRSVIADQQARTMITLVVEQMKVMQKRIDELEAKVAYERRMRLALNESFLMHQRRANH